MSRVVVLVLCFPPTRFLRPGRQRRHCFRRLRHRAEELRWRHVRTLRPGRESAPQRRGAPLIA
eukprot:4670501-Pyramimonas_sp.AAC.1